jgi:hypothetical protein
MTNQIPSCNVLALLAIVTGDADHCFIRITYSPDSLIG